MPIWLPKKFERPMSFKPSVKPVGEYKINKAHKSAPDSSWLFGSEKMLDLSNNNNSALLPSDVVFKDNKYSILDNNSEAITFNKNLFKSLTSFAVLITISNSLTESAGFIGDYTSNTDISFLLFTGSTGALYLRVKTDANAYVDCIDASINYNDGLCRNILAYWDGTEQGFYVDGKIKAYSANIGASLEASVTRNTAFGAYGAAYAGTNIKGYIASASAWFNRVPANLADISKNPYQFLVPK